jgi:hypothetical protein
MLDTDFGEHLFLGRWVNSVGWSVGEVLVGDRRAVMSLQRWFYAGGRPNRVARILDRCTAALSARGVGPDYLVTLEVPGRRSGRIVCLPLVVAVVDGERYLVSMLGEETNWVRNVKAAGGDVALVHGRREDVHPEEVVAPGCAGSPRARAKGLLEASDQCQRASADRQGRAAHRVRAGVVSVPRVPGRAEEHGVSTPRKTLRWVERMEL